MTEPDLSWVNKYFGEPWPSGVCDDGEQVATPVGMPCVHCSVPIEEGDRGSFVGTALLGHPFGNYGPVHRECSLRAVLGGIGHLQDHAHWCVEEGDPDAGHSYRLSALMVWERVTAQGILGHFPLLEDEDSWGDY